jgi:heme/copper-type cytochrome/quinol oxidase subunit 3
VSHAPATASHEAPTHEVGEGGHHYQPSVPISIGKFAMWLFLATEIMFFTGLIGSYIVLRFGSKHWPTPEARVVVLKTGEEVRGEEKSVKADEIELVLETGKTRIIKKEEAKEGHHGWYEKESPLNLPLTAANTFLLICSSVTMVLALAAIQGGDKKKLNTYLLATVIMGAIFVSVQVYEYNKLIAEHFVPSTNIFASCFYVMTGCHGAHVTGGVIYLFTIYLRALRGKFTQQNHESVEIAGLYWHFVDLVWILLFTVVYLI